MATTTTGRHTGDGFPYGFPRDKIEFDFLYEFDRPWFPYGFPRDKIGQTGAFDAHTPWFPYGFPRDKIT